MSVDHNQQSIGLLQTTSLVTGNLVGSGVFLLPATLALYGTVSLFSWVITAIGAILLSLVFAKLSQSTKNNGGPHNFVGEAFGKESAFMTAWGYWVLSWISNAALVVASVSYLAPLLGGLSSSTTLALEIIVLFSITLVNIIGIQVAGRFEVVLTFLKVLPLLIIPAIGIFFVNWDNFSPIVPEGLTFWGSMKFSIFLTIWGFVGLETGTVPAGEVKNPHRNIPIATILGTSIAALVYILGTFVILGVIPRDILIGSNAPYSELASILFGGSWGVPIAITAVLCCLGSFNGWTLIVGRIAQGAANQGLFPKFFSKTFKNGTPYLSIIISSMCTLPLLVFSMQENLVDQFNFIIDVSITLILLIYCVCTIVYFCTTLKEKVSLQAILVGTGALFFVLLSIWAAGINMLFLSLLILVLGIPFRLLVNYANKREPQIESVQVVPVDAE